MAGRRERTARRRRSGRRIGGRWGHGRQTPSYGRDSTHRVMLAPADSGEPLDDEHHVCNRSCRAARRIPTFRSIAAIAAVLRRDHRDADPRITSLADVRGALGVGVDEGAWINTAFASQMFVGPLAIAAAFMFGTRRVLVAAPSCFSAPRPCCRTQFGAFVVFQAIAGRVRRVRPADGRLRRPDAAAATHCVRHRRVCDESRDVAEPVGTLEGWYSEHLSWRLLFWQNAVLTVPFIACLLLSLADEPVKRFASGLDARDAARRRRLRVPVRRARPGERLFWLQSPLIVALLALGILMVAAFLIHEPRRRVRPRPRLSRAAERRAADRARRPRALHRAQYELHPSLFLASTTGCGRCESAIRCAGSRFRSCCSHLRRAAAAARRSAPADRGRLRDGGDRLRARRAPHVRVGRTRLHSVATAAGARADDGADVGDLLFGKHVTAEHALTFGAVVQTTRLLSGQLGTTSIAVIQRIRRVPIRISSVCMCRCRIPRRSSGCAPARRRW